MCSKGTVEIIICEILFETTPLQSQSPSGIVQLLYKSAIFSPLISARAFRNACTEGSALPCNH